MAFWTAAQVQTTPAQRAAWHIERGIRVLFSLFERQVEVELREQYVISAA